MSNHKPANTEPAPGALAEARHAAFPPRSRTASHSVAYRSRSNRSGCSSVAAIGPRSPSTWSPWVHRCHRTRAHQGCQRNDDLLPDTADVSPRDSGQRSHRRRRADSLTTGASISLLVGPRVCDPDAPLLVLPFRRRLAHAPQEPARGAFTEVAKPPLQVLDRRFRISVRGEEVVKGAVLRDEL